MPPPHNGISLCEKTYNMLEVWGIETKVFTITLDNASSNDVCVGLLRNQLNMKKAIFCEGKFFHIRCCVHILNLRVQDGLKEIDSALQKIRDSVKCFFFFFFLCLKKKRKEHCEVLEDHK
jgi:hypothetical protein